MLAEIERKLGKFEDVEERGERRVLLDRLAEIVTEEDRSTLLALSAALDSPGVRPGVVDDREALTSYIPEKPLSNVHVARAKNTLALLLDRARLTEECYSSADVQKILGLSRQRLGQLREEGRLVAIGGGPRRSMLYPYWQFSASGRILEGMERILEAAREADISPYGLHFWMTEPTDRLGGHAPVDLLEEGRVEELVSLLEASGPEGF